jgi:hypothetical protein
MYKTIIAVFVVLVTGLSVVGLSNAFILEPEECVVNNTKLIGTLGTQAIESDYINCDLSQTDYDCSYTLELYVEVSDHTFQFVEVPFYCSGDIVKIDNVQCFYSKGDLYCPLVDSDKVHTFHSDGDTFIFPDETPIFRFGVVEDGRSR